MAAQHQAAPGKEIRDGAQVEAALYAFDVATIGSTNLMLRMKVALIAGATLGQIADERRSGFGEYRPSS